MSYIDIRHMHAIKSRRSVGTGQALRRGRPGVREQERALGPR